MTVENIIITLLSFPSAVNFTTAFFSHIMRPNIIVSYFMMLSSYIEH